MPVNRFEKELEQIRQITGSAVYTQRIQAMRRRFSSRPLILYGAGAIGSSAARFLSHYDIAVRCFCDKNKSGIQESSGLPIISPHQMIQQYPDANIIVCSMNYKGEIIKELIQLGIPEEQIYCRDMLHLHEMAYEDFIPHIEGYRRTYDLLQDEWSRNVLLERVRCYLLSSPITSSGAEKQYFDPEIMTPDPKAVFVDGGMYTGDTAQSFFQFFNGQYGHYYGFEPDSRNFQAAEENLKDKANCTLVKKGLWRRETQLSFSGSLSRASHLNEGENGEFVDVTALDVFFQDQAAPTFIKMDVEGAELDALRGAERLIRDGKPKLAICVYHKPEDIYTLPELIKTFRQDYIFYLRHYSDTIYETVLYAV